MFNFIQKFFSSKSYKSSFDVSLEKMNKNCEYMKSLVSTLPDCQGKQKVIHELERNSQAIHKMMK